MTISSSWKWGVSIFIQWRCYFTHFCMCVKMSSQRHLYVKILYMFSLLDLYLLLFVGPVKTAKYSLFYSQDSSSYLCSMVQTLSCTAPICNTYLYLVLCRNFFLHTSIQYDYIYHALIMVCFLCRNFFLHTGAK